MVFISTENSIAFKEMKNTSKSSKAEETSSALLLTKNQTYPSVGGVPLKASSFSIRSNCTGLLVRADS